MKTKLLNVVVYLIIGAGIFAAGMYMQSVIYVNDNKKIIRELASNTQKIVEISLKQGGNKIQNNISDNKIKSKGKGTQDFDMENKTDSTKIWEIFKFWQWGDSEKNN